MFRHRSGRWRTNGSTHWKTTVEHLEAELQRYEERLSALESEVEAERAAREELEQEVESDGGDGVTGRLGDVLSSGDC